MIRVEIREKAGAPLISQIKARHDASEYYNSTQWVYNLGNAIFARNSQMIHYGLWFHGTESLAEALMNVNKVAASSLRIEPSDVVLDAGCGVGGTSIFFARNYGCRVVGINVSEVQLRQARRYLGKSKVGHLCEFYNMDFTKTSFADETFTRIVGIESISYAAVKADFVREAYRLLSPGGRLVVIDGFMRRAAYTMEETDILTKFLEGWKLPSISSLEEFGSCLTETGFTNILYVDFRKYGIPSAIFIHKVHAVLYPALFLLHKIGAVSDIVLHHFQAAVLQKLLNCGEDPILTGGMFTAEKP